MEELDRADRQPELVPEARVDHLKEKLVTVKEQIQRLNAIGEQMQQASDGQISLTDPTVKVAMLMHDPWRPVAGVRA